MTTNTPLYYFTRTLVRFTFWSAVGLLSMLGIGKLADIVNPDDENPCRIVLSKNFTWENDGQLFVDINKCDAPNSVLLNQNGTWEWEL